MGNRAAVVVVFLFLCLGLAAQHSSSAAAPESLAAMETAEARQALRETVLEAEIGRLSTLRVAPVYQRLYNTTVTVAIRARESAVDIVLRVSRPDSDRGTFTLTRGTRNGRAVELRIQTRDDPGSYLVARPLGERSTMDVHHLDATMPLYRGVLIPLPFDELIVSSLERIVALTSMKVDWPFLLHTGSGLADRSVEGLAAAIHARLGGLRDADDGAIGQDGRYVYIADGREQAGPGGLNCSGFVKWLVDAFHYPLTGRLTSVEAAKRPPEEPRQNTFSEALYYLDPYFGLDWTRNLAALLDQARGGRSVSPRSFDVREVERMVYTVDLGYPVEELPLLLYTLAVRSPGAFYLASVAGVIDEDVGLRQHFHTLALLPYFDGAGRFQVAVFERILSTSLASLLRRYQGLRIHLVRASAEGPFEPLELD